MRGSTCGGLLTRMVPPRLSLSCTDPLGYCALSAALRLCEANGRRRFRFHRTLQTRQRLIESNRWAQVTANEPSPTAKPTRLIDPERISPAASMPGTVVSSGQG